MSTNKIPKKYLDLVGTKQRISGGVFGRKAIPEAEYEVLDIRWGSGFYIPSIKKFMANPDKAVRHPTFELLVKSKGMTRSRWTRGFPMKDVKL